jgi:hypothetical protein
MIFNFISKSVGRVARLASVGIAALALASCGGGGGSAGTEQNSGGNTVSVSSLAISFSSNQLTTTSTTPVTVTVTALGAGGVVIPNVTIQFASDTGIITPSATPSVTGTNGTVTAALSIGSNVTPRTISVSATGGGKTISGTVQVVGTTTTTPTIKMLFSSPTLASAGAASGAVTVSALVQDSNNNALSGVPVTFTATSGVLTVTAASGTTNTSGLATASLNTAGSQTNRTITVTATGGGATTTGTIQVTGTTLTPSSAPTALTLGVVQKFTFTLQDSAGNNIPNAPVTFTSASGNTVVADSSDAGTSSAPITNSNGVVILDVTPTVSGQDTLTVTADGASSSASFNVTNQSLSVVLTDITTSPATVVSTTPQPITEYVNSACIAVNATYTVNGVGAAGLANVNTSLGTLYTNAACSNVYVPSTATPLTFAANGQMTPVYLRTTTIGNAVVTVSEATGSVVGPTQSASVNLISRLTSAYTPSITLTASPNVVAPNSITSPNTNSSSIIATVRDGSPQNNLVQGVPVAFSVTDPSGGSISPPVILTQANGQAIATYYPGSGTTAANAVIAKAQIQGSVIAPAVTVPLTVSGTSLFVTLGTGNLINTVGDTSFSQDWTVYVTDSNGNPVANAAISAQLVALYYSKGSMAFFTSPVAEWAPNPATQPTDGYTWPVIASGGPYCPNSDVNNDGIYDTGDITIYYPNSTTIWPYVEPGIPGNVAPTAGTATNSSGLALTGANGFAGVTVTYPQDHAYWTIVQLTVNAATNGSQSTATTSFLLKGVVGAYTAQNVAPPGQVSPYGVNNCVTAF